MLIQHRNKLIMPTLRKAMGQPTPSDVHVDAALTDISVAYMQNANNFIAQRVFPTVGVAKQSDKYFTWNKDAFFRDEVTKRAPGSESSGGGIPLDTASYSCDVWAHHKDVDDQTRANADPSANPDDVAAEWITQLMMIRREREWASNFFTTGIWGTDVVGATDFTRWDDAASDPEANITTAKETILLNTGYEPNTLVVGYQVHNALKRHPLIKDRYKHTSADSITETMIARFFEVDRYFVARSVYNTSNEGDTTPTYSFIQGKHAMLCYSAPSPALMTPTAGYTFAWRGLTGLNDASVQFTRFRMQHLKSDRIEGEFAFDMHKVAGDMGYFFSGAVA